MPVAIIPATDPLTIGDLKPGDKFVTLLTHRSGVVRERIGSGAEVELEGIVTYLHPEVRIKKIPGVWMESNPNTDKYIRDPKGRKEDTKI